MTGDDPLRALWRDQPTKEVPEMSIEVLRERSDRLARKVSQRKWSETFAGGVSIALLAALGVRVTSAPLVQLACALLVVGEAVVLVSLWRRSKPRPTPLSESTAGYLAYYRDALVKERDLLGTVWRWYLAPGVPGLVLFPIAVSMEIGVSPAIVGASALASIGLVFAIIVLAYRHTSRKLAREIEALDLG
jgi:hypothetical protein